MNVTQDNNAAHAVNDALSAKVLERYHAARKRRGGWETLWQDCYDYALPQRGGFNGSGRAGEGKTEHIFDATAMDAADQLASSILANLTPTWSGWFGLKAGPELSEEEAAALAPVLEKASAVMQSHFDRSNFAVEIHQCYLDLVVGGTASLMFEETTPGSFSAFQFSSVALKNIVLEEGENGALDGAFRTLSLTLSQVQARYKDAVIPAKIERGSAKDPQMRFDVLEAILPNGHISEYFAFLMDETSGGQPLLIQAGQFESAPIISFRWLKSPGETYGRSPVMKALPDIKTANKVVELILKNASIAVTGIWQADDDGVLNPANIELKPGAIIPKAIGSKGLQPLDMPGRFDISEIVLDNLQARIRHALLADKLAPITGARMTATEIVERSAEMSMLLGATYGRLQSELLTPLIKRAYHVLRRRGEVPDLNLDGRVVTIDFRAPLAKAQGQRNVQNTLSWINSVMAMGEEGKRSVNITEAARYLGDALGVPSHLIRKEVLMPDAPIEADIEGDIL